ncbi:UvrD-helicase domain-containing protein [Streptomyces sp. NPDC020192]|uniref:UvrD-helicase domain-containing protein n=1 Tax=Streptomyces sp. NPDC020192 TaxID=3365066 RepID=UPI00379C2C46
MEALLLDDLNLPRNGTTRDIVDTVQREQLLLVAHQRPGALVIQGGPGTGKTAVGLYRVMWLLDNQRCSAQDVLVVGPHQGFLDYAGQVLPALGGETSPPSPSTASWPATVPDPRRTPTPPRRPSSKVRTGWPTCWGGPPRRTAVPTVPESHHC